MSKTKHTPAPWSAEKRGDYADFDEMSRVIVGDDRRIAAVHHSGDAEDEANTQLISAAPDLLSAVKEMLLHGGESVEEWIDMKYYRKAELAIAKAEGRTA
jgi:hypothetical protein